ncbi:MAG TPA: FtsX-like permease family protein [Bacilli bacterium]
MALLVMILRKMVKNKWLELTLLLGLILTVALVSSIPIYTESILQRMLVKDLENLQKNTNSYPGAHLSSAYFGGDIQVENVPKLLKYIDYNMANVAKPGFSLPVKEYVQERETKKYNFLPLFPDLINPKIKRLAEIGAMSGLEDHVRLVDGRLPAKNKVDGVYEALVVEEALNKLKMVLGNEFVLKDESTHIELTIKPVGVIDKKTYDSVYWSAANLNTYQSTFFINYELFESDFTTSNVLPVLFSRWYYALDYSNMGLDNIQSYIDTHTKIRTMLSNRFTNYSIKSNALTTLGEYAEREKRLMLMLWSLNVPVMIMLAFYLFMVSNLITERQKTEIAVLRSRGASRFQILSGYMIEGLILGVIAILTGPYLGLWLTKILGASNGFLSFVQRSSLQAELNDQTYKYALIAAASSLVMTLIPSFLATRVSIVSHKQQMARQHHQSFWHKFYIDIFLLAAAFYGFISFQRRMKDLVSLGLDSDRLKIDPLLFLVPALFILGLGLFILRIYPWFIRILHWLGRKWWPPGIYSTMIQVGRASGQYQFIMIFLIITIATGIFSASAARTMNKNIEDKVNYKNGADIILNVRWENDAPPPPVPGMPVPAEAEAGPKKKVQFTEPPFELVDQLPGIEEAAKVFIKDGVYVSAAESGIARLMGVDTDDFGRASWLKDGLLDHHYYRYLNLIAGEPSAVLISKTLAAQQGVKTGDYIYVGWEGVDSKAFIVYGIVDFFPSFNPNPQDVKQKAPMLVVGNLEYIQNNLALEPYQVWLKLKPGVESRKQLFDGILEKKIPVESLIDTREELVSAKNDPYQLAINGMMTLGFVISILISFIGFLLYWVLSMRSRTLQFGILRAMGISFSQLIAMLTTEQILTSGAAILIGILTGNYASQLFVPFFQISFNMVSQVPPFEVSFDSGDFLKIYVIITIMISLGLFILGYLLSRIKIHQAVKLGED